MYGVDMFQKRGWILRQRTREQHLPYQDGLDDCSTLHVMLCMQNILGQEEFDEIGDG